MVKAAPLSPVNKSLQLQHKLANKAECRALVHITCPEGLRSMYVRNTTDENEIFIR